VYAPKAEGQRREREKKKVRKEMDKQGSCVCVVDRLIDVYMCAWLVDVYMRMTCKELLVGRRVGGESEKVGKTTDTSAIGWRRLIGCLKLQVIFAKEPLIIGLFFGKPMKRRHPMTLCHPVLYTSTSTFTS